MRLIDANTLIKEAYAEGAYGYVDAKQIADAPAINAVEVVRCRECTEFDEAEHECSHWYGFRETDFCSHGVRKEGAN